MSTPHKKNLIIDYPFALSDGTVVFVSLPADLTVEDAERLCSMVRTLPSTEEPLGGVSAAARCPKCKSTDPHVCIPKRATAHRHPHLKWWPPNLEAAPGCCDDPFHSVPAAAPEPEKCENCGQQLPGEHTIISPTRRICPIPACPTCGSTDRAVKRKPCNEALIFPADAWHSVEEGKE